MEASIRSLWGKLWNMHDDTKNTLLFFSTKISTKGNKNSVSSNQNESGNNGEEHKSSRSKAQNVGLFLGPLFFFVILLFLSPPGMPKEAVAVLASTVWIATWWITEAIPIPATSLLPIILFPLTGAVEGGVTSAYADNTIFLFLGGFFIAIAMEKWNLHRRIALNIILLVGTSTQRIILGFMVATGFLSMWISNTATAMMMMPIGIAVIAHVNATLNIKNAKDSKFGKAIMLGIAYSASIGGVGTLIGTPPNTIFVGVVRKLYDIDISFATWMLFGVPIAVVLLFAVWLYLVKIAFPMDMKELPGGKAVIQDQRTALGKMSMEEKLVAAVFIFAAVFWVTRTFIPLDIIQTRINDTTIAIIAAILLFILPSKKAVEGNILNWKDATNMPWGILLLFGGGLAIADGFKESGLALYIGEQLTFLQGANLIVVILVVVTLVLFLTEITSNTATATMMFPIMASFAAAIDVHPYGLMIAAGVAASCAFMLPVATPPNAVVFGSGYLKITDMVKAGFWINVSCIFFITAAIYFLLPLVWGIDLNVFPDALK